MDPLLRAGVRLLPDELRSVADRARAAARHSQAAQRVHLSAGLRGVHSGHGRLQAASRVWRRHVHVVQRLPAQCLHPAGGDSIQRAGPGTPHAGGPAQGAVRQRGPVVQRWRAPATGRHAGSRERSGGVEQSPLARVSALKSSVDERLVRLFRQLGLDRVHLAARVAADWRGLATTHPETIASLTLVCPTGLDATPLGALTSRVLVLTGDQGTPAEAISKAMAAHPEASIITLNDYYGHPRADLLTDRAEDIGAAMLAFLARMDQLHAVKPVRLPAQEGDLDGISYRIQGAGVPVLLPLGLAASQWEPLLPRLSAQYCTLTLGGAILAARGGSHCDEPV